MKYAIAVSQRIDAIFAGSLSDRIVQERDER
jgi:hypothetical protein